MTDFRTRFTALAGLGLALLTVSCGAAPAETPPATAPAAAEDIAGVSAETIAKLEATMAGYVANGDVKGIATRLVKDGVVVSDMRAGVAREAGQAPIAEDTIYRIYSMTKPITGVALMILWEEGKFQLDDPVTKYIPEFEGLQVFTGLDANGEPVLEPVKRPPTIQELMSHTAGFGYGLRRGDYVNDRFQELEVLRAPTAQAMIDRVATIPLLHQPGEVWDYSIAVDIQGYLVEKFSGQSLGAFMQERIFAPLGMVDTGFYVSDEKYGRFADVYMPDQQGGFIASDAPGFLFRKDTIAFEGGGHGLVSTMDDYMRFAEMLVNDGTLDGAQILKPETVRLMAENHLPDGVFIGENGTGSNTSTGVGFGLDFGVILETGPEQPFPKGAFMWGGAAGTWFWVDPANDLCFVGMIQHFGGTGPGFNGRVDAPRIIYEGFQEQE